MSESPFQILLVDDNDFVVRTLSRQLEGEGYGVKVARDGANALQVFEQDPVDLVLLDVRMPGLDGLEVLQTLRRLHSANELPVIMVTANGASDDVVNAFDLGANDYVTKPLDYPVVKARIQTQLRSRTPGAKRRTPGRPIFSDIRLGTLIEGRYRLDSQIGEGQFGAVFRATHLKLQRPVAVKILSTPLEEKDLAWQRFHQEGVTMSRLQHPNAVSVLDFSLTGGGMPFLVMELLEGHTLEEELIRHGQLSVQRSAEIVLQIAQVLSEAHSLGIVHRDIKPQNIFLHQSRQGEVVKVLDFGIAKLIDESRAGRKLTREGDGPGTPAYMAPERYSDLPYDGRADVYSLGILLFEMLVGRLPFVCPDGNPMKIALLHLSEPPPLLRTFRSELPRRVEEVVLRTLEKRAEDRPHVADLARDLASVAGLPLPPSLHPSSPAQGVG